MSRFFPNYLPSQSGLVKRRLIIWTDGRSPTPLHPVQCSARPHPALFKRKKEKDEKFTSIGLCRKRRVKEAAAAFIDPSLSNLKKPGKYWLLSLMKGWEEIRLRVRERESVCVCHDSKALQNLIWYIAKRVPTIFCRLLLLIQIHFSNVVSVGGPSHLVVKKTFSRTCYYNTRSTAVGK